MKLGDLWKLENTLAIPLPLPYLWVPFLHEAGQHAQFSKQNCRFSASHLLDNLHIISQQPIEKPDKNVNNIVLEILLGHTRTT